MKVVVTGGAGYVGSVIAAHLLRAGHDVIVVDNLSRGHRQSIPAGATFVEADIADFASSFTRADAIDAVIHCASFISVAESMRLPELYWENNAIKSFRLLQAVHALGIPKFVFSSTAAVYGDPQQMEPLTEESPTKPTNVYGMTKLATDMAIQSFAACYGLAAASLRYFNVAGAEGEFGERHTEETHIIPLALKAAADNQSFTLYGTDYPTHDGTCIRDYIHVSDLADAHLLALDNVTAGKHAIYNLGTGRGVSNSALLSGVKAATGKSLSITIADNRAGDAAMLVASNDKARRELGWEPSKSLQDILADAWVFYQTQTASIPPLQVIPIR